MEKITDGIYRIGVPLLRNPLKEVNSYLVKGKERDLLIDTGFRRAECKEALTEGLKAAGSSGPVDIFLTHLHSDHSGMAADIAGADSRIFMHEKDLILMQRVLDGRNKIDMAKRFVSEGMDADMVERIQTTNPARLSALGQIDGRFQAIRDGHTFHVGKYDLKAVWVPGHSPGQMMLWIESEKIMFTGDHILFDITPNITAYAEMGDALGLYLDGLRRTDVYPVEYALPGHRKTGNYHERIRELLAHHEKRIEEAEQIVRQHPGMTAYEITGYMTWRIHAPGKTGRAAWEEFPETQRWYAMGECLSHLDHIRLAGRIKRRQADGVYRYFAD